MGEKAVKDIIADGIISREKTTNEDGKEVAQRGYSAVGKDARGSVEE